MGILKRLALAFVVPTVLAVSSQPAFAQTCPAGIVGWWPGNGTALDASGNNHGQLFGDATYAQGIVGQGFKLDGSGDYVQIADSALLKPAQVSVEAWVRFDSLDTPIVSTFGVAGQEYIVFKKNTRTFNFEGYALFKKRVSGVDRLAFAVGNVLGANATAESTSVIVAGQFYHVVGTYDGVRSSLYVNGVLQSQAAGSINIDYDTRPVFIGTTGETVFDGKLNGIVDEATIYNRALSASEAAALFAAGSNGKCQTAPPAITQHPVGVTVNAGAQVSFTAAATGAPSPTVQWQVSTNNSGIWTNIGGATATTYAFTTTAADNGKLYRAVFTNSAGSTATAAALLTVDSTPVITLNPLSQTVGRTFTVRFTAAATGVPVPFVKWQVSVGGGGFTDIPGATSATYSFAAAFSDNGNQYRAVFSNVVGSTNTSPATLTVINATNTQKGADFNGDDKADIFWRNYATGANMVWEMNGGTRLNTIDLDRIGNINLKVVGLGDFNGDGKVDLVTRNNLTGLSRIYFGNGFGFPTTFDLPLVNDPNWRIVAVADFNGDGMPDLFWRNVATGIDDLWTMNGTAIAINELAETVNDPNWLIVTAGDFDGDGKADLYWRQRGTGVSAIWFMNRATRIGYGTPPTVSDQTWQIVAAADWSGDGRADVLWRNGVTGVNAMWNMNGASMIGYIEPPVLADTNWSPAPISRDPHDFNADGYADLLWLNSVSGVATAWYMNGGARLGDGNPPYVGGSTWQLAGTGDFNGDGKPDFVWRNPSLGWNVVWLMNGLTQIGYVEIENIPGPAWGIAAVADFDGDGKTDIAWRNQVTGDDVIWSMDGVTRIGYTALATVNDPAWHIVGSGDFDGNGSPDLVWRNFATGAETVWYMNGTTFLGSALLEPVADATWHIVAVADYNGDGYPDIVWRNVVSGVNVMWFMNNTTRIGYATITPVGDPTWTIVPNGG